VVLAHGLNDRTARVQNVNFAGRPLLLFAFFMSLETHSSQFFKAKSHTYISQQQQKKKKKKKKTKITSKYTCEEKKRKEKRRKKMFGVPVNPLEDYLYSRAMAPKVSARALYLSRWVAQYTVAQGIPL
jgi:hypothetical protein